VRERLSFGRAPQDTRLRSSRDRPSRDSPPEGNQSHSSLNPRSMLRCLRDTDGCSLIASARENRAHARSRSCATSKNAGMAVSDGSHAGGTSRDVGEVRLRRCGIQRVPAPEEYHTRRHARAGTFGVQSRCVLRDSVSRIAPPNLAIRLHTWKPASSLAPRGVAVWPVGIIMCRVPVSRRRRARSIRRRRCSLYGERV